MDIGLYITAAGLVLLAALLLHGLSVVRALGARFELLDREQQIPRLRRVLAACSALALGCAAIVLALAVLDPGSKGDRRVAMADDRETPPAAAAPPATAPAPAIEPPAVTEPPPASTPEPPPARRPAPEPARKSRLPEPAAAPSAAPDSWRATRVVSNGEVTLRAWPNGTALSSLAPGDRVFTRGERREAGGHTWEKVRLTDGRYGWMVSRFVAAD